MKDRCEIGIDAAYELSKILSEEWSKAVDKEILRSLGYEPDRRKRRKISIEKVFKSSEYF